MAMDLVQITGQVNPAPKAPKKVTPNDSSASVKPANQQGNKSNKSSNKDIPTIDAHIIDRRNKIFCRASVFHTKNGKIVSANDLFNKIQNVLGKSSILGYPFTDYTIKLNGNNISDDELKDYRPNSGDKIDFTPKS